MKEVRRNCAERIFRSVLSLVLVLAMLAGGLLPVTVSAADDPVYFVTGESNLCGSAWNPADPSNKMDCVGDNLYQKVYPGVEAGIYGIKVTDGTWDNTWGDNDQNYIFDVTAKCDVTVTFDSNTNTVSVTGDNVTRQTSLNVDYITAVGNGDGSWLNGVEWNQKSDANKMTEVSTGVYEITYKDVQSGPIFEVKFVANGSWADNWGGTYAGSGVETDAVYNSSENISFDINYDVANVTLKLDLTGFDYSTKSGAKFTITIVDAEAPVAVDYYLFGYINGANHACEEDYENLGDYKFVDGKLTAKFSQTSYVGVKTADGDWYMTDGWQGEVTETTLYNTKDLGSTANKLMVPADKELTFTLTENADGTLTLGYEIASEEPATEYYLFGYINGANHACEEDNENLGDYKFVNGKLTAQFSQTSYVGVKTVKNADDHSFNWFMTDGWQGEVTETTLYNADDLGSTANKLMVPADKELTFTLTENADGTLTLGYEIASEEPATEYYLFGYINGANYGCEEDYENLGDYKFVDGKLTAKFSQTSYVAVKTADGNWFMTDDWQGEVTETTLYNTKDLGSTANKLMVPADKELTFTLTENADGTLTLSYTMAGTEPVVPEGYTAVRIHFYRPSGWSGDNVNAYIWDNSNAVPGYEAYHSWPGKAISANTTHAGWYDLLVATKDPMQFSFIFNNGTSQSGNLSTGVVTGDMELWVIGDEVMTTAPGEWSGTYTYTAIIHFRKPAEWGSTVNAHVYDVSGDPLEGSEYCSPWPGAPIEADPALTGWYNFSFTETGDGGFKFIFNDVDASTNPDGSKTDDLFTGKLKVKTELWVENNQVLTEAPADWVDSGRTVYIPGTFPGPSWDSGSNQMTYDPDLGLYVYTFKDVPAANYAYKIAINGSWNENYGLGGAPNGSNISVTVPSAQDVTIWYSDKTHNSVTSIDYVFADIELKGTGIPDGTKLTDPGLTGIYSVTLPMAVGTYSDLTLSFGGNEYPISEFELTDEKEVTFFCDPVSGLFYHNGSDAKVNGDAIYYNSKDADYKSPYGAVAVGEDVTFAITTGDDAVQVMLVVKGVGSFPMSVSENADQKKWTCTVKFDKYGEYDYYFAISNGSDVKVYCDDDGYYGEGTTSELTSVLPYDLIVYQAGFETPDWMKDAVIYQIFPDRFYDGDSTNNQAQLSARGEVGYEFIGNWYTLPENPEQESKAGYPDNAHRGDGEWSNEIYGGDLQGIIDRMDYLKALGVNVIYLNPVFASISSHRYDACDYTQIDPILGTEGDFSALVAAAEANGMHIILDGVFNHVSDDSVYFDRYYKFLGKSEKIGAYPYWAYVYDYMDENNAEQAAAETAAKAYFTENYGITDYAYTEWFVVYHAEMKDGTETVTDGIGLRQGKPVYRYDGWWGYDSMPIIYSTNGSEYQTGNWAEEIIYNENGTSVTQYWISKGSDGWRLDVANEVSDETWQHFRKSVKAMNSDAVIVGEIWDDATKYILGDMYDSVMNYMFRNAVTGFALGTSSDETTMQMEKIRERYPEEAFYAMMNLVGSHDTTRILSYLDGIPDDRTGATMATAFPTYASTSQTAKQRQYLVAFLQFTYAGAPTIYYGDEIGMVGADDPDDRRAMEWGKGSQELVEWYAKLAAVRGAYSALRTGSVEPITTDNSNVMGYVRRDSANALIVLANNSMEACEINLSLSDLNMDFAVYTDLLNLDCTADGANGEMTVTVPALNGVILVAQDKAKAVLVNSQALAPAYDASYIVADRVVHSYKFTKTVAPTCTEEGYDLYTCADDGCGQTIKQNIVSASGHKWGEWETKKEATCGEDGEKIRTCGVCKVEEKDKISATGNHDWGEWETKKEATCTEAGEKVRACGVCHETEKDTISAIHPEGHSWGAWKTTKEATCTEEGEKTRACTLCSVTKTKTIPVKDHTPVTDKAVSPTCTQTGLTEGKHCSVCGEILKAQTVVKATGHKYKDKVIAPTCAERGYTVHTCSVCHDTYSDTYVPATGNHTYTNGADKTCDVCGHYRQIETIQMYRLYNPNSGEHFYTGSAEERDNLVDVGWNYEGVAWNAPKYYGDPVYRLFNPNSGDHLFTMNLEEVDTLKAEGWQYEGVAWNSATEEFEDRAPQYRLFNPNAETGAHHYTGSKEERDHLMDLGWKLECIGWYGLIH